MVYSDCWLGCGQNNLKSVLKIWQTITFMDFLEKENKYTNVNLTRPLHKCIIVGGNEVLYVVYSLCKDLVEL